MTRFVHPIAGALAMVTIATFWLSTVVGELHGPPALVVAVKTTIPWGFLLLVPALAVVGASGIRLSRGRRDGLAAAKARRMRFVALNGVLVLLPSALFLAQKSQAGSFDTVFFAVQGLELLAGAANLTLLGLNLRDGLRMRARNARHAPHRDLKKPWRKTARS